VIDIMATCLDVAGAQYPKEHNGKAIAPLEGISLRPAFEGKPLSRSRPIFWEHEENRAILDGRWKLVSLAGQPWRLYDTLADRTEQRDLAGEQPEKVKVLAAKWDEYAARANVLPLGGWREAAPAKGKKAAAALSKETRFDLRPGEHLERARAPAIAGRGFTITAKFDAKTPQGVIVAQGGAARGYALYLKEGKLVFSVRTSTEQVTSVATAEVVVGVHTAEARLKKDGELSLALSGKAVVSGRAPALIQQMPVDGLDVGSDTAGQVGTYATENPFQGSIDFVRIELD
jgi:arylsulfatase